MAFLKLDEKAKRKAGRPSRKEAKVRLEELFDAATVVFLEEGYAAASTNEIARRAGASKQTLYSRYSTKSELFRALIDRRSSALHASLATSLDVDAEPEVALIAFGTQMVATMLSMELQQLYRLVIAESGPFPELALAYWERGSVRARDLLKQYLLAQVERKKLKIDNLQFATEQFTGSLLGGLVTRCTLRVDPFLQSEQDIQAWVQSTVEMFLAGHRFVTPRIRAGSQASR